MTNQLTNGRCSCIARDTSVLTGSVQVEGGCGEHIRGCVRDWPLLAF